MSRPPRSRPQERAWSIILVLLVILIVGTITIWRGLAPETPDDSISGPSLITPTILVAAATPSPPPTARPPDPSPTIPVQALASPTAVVAPVSTPTPEPTPQPRPTVTPTPVAVANEEAVAVVQEMFDALDQNDYPRALEATSGTGREQIQTMVTNIQDEGRRRGAQPELEVSRLELQVVESRDDGVLVNADFTTGVYAQVAIFRALVETIVGSAVFLVSEVDGEAKIVEVVSAEGLPGL